MRRVVAHTNGVPEILKPATDNASKHKVHLLKEEPNADCHDWYGNVALHHAATVDPPDLERVHKLIAQHPDGAKTKNQFGSVSVYYFTALISNCLI